MSLSNELYTRLTPLGGFDLPRDILSEFINHICSKWYRNKRPAPLSFTKWYSKMYPEEYDKPGKGAEAGVQSQVEGYRPIPTTSIHACRDCGVIHNCYPETPDQEVASSPEPEGRRPGSLLEHAGGVYITEPPPLGPEYKSLILDHFAPS